MSTPFLMNEEVEEILCKLRNLADKEERIISLEQLKAGSKGFNPKDPTTRSASIIPLDQTVKLPFGWQVTFTVEEQPFGLARHMSMSSPRMDKTPVPEVIKWVLPLLGFKSNLLDCKVYVEHYSKNRHAINVMEKILDN